MRAKKNRVLRGFQEFHKGFRRGSMKGYHHGLCAMKVPFRLGLQWVHEVGFVVWWLEGLFLDFGVGVGFTKIAVGDPRLFCSMLQGV